MTEKKEATIQDFAQRHTMTALRTLVHQCLYGKKESAKVTAAMGLLAYGWGRPTQFIKHDATEATQHGLLTAIMSAHSSASALLEASPTMERVIEENIDELVEYAPANARKRPPSKI